MDRGKRGMLPLLAFHFVNEYSRLERKPPVTAGLLAVNTLFYLRMPASLDRILPHIDQVWFNPYLILKHRDLKRFFLSAFYHIDESHLVYNMVSLLWKGIRLENSMGSLEFARMVAVLLGLSQGVTLLLAKALLHLFDYRSPYYREYAVGFSGVLFAMKVVLNSQQQSADSYTTVHGGLLEVPTRYAAWTELLIIQAFVPNASFLGHLGGILAGIIYLKFKAFASNPSRGRGSNSLLARVFWCLRNICSFPFRILLRFNPLNRRHNLIWGRGTVGGGGGGQSHQRTTLAADGSWSCQACTFDNSGYLNVCEMCGTSRSNDFNDDEDGGLASQRSSNYFSQDLSPEELRLRRVRRFGSR